MRRRLRPRHGECGPDRVPAAAIPRADRDQAGAAARKIALIRRMFPPAVTPALTAAPSLECGGIDCSGAPRRIAGGTTPTEPRSCVRGTVGDAFPVQGGGRSVGATSYGRGPSKEVAMKALPIRE